MRMRMPSTSVPRISVTTEMLLIRAVSLTPTTLIRPASSRTMIDTMIIRDLLPTFRPSTVPIVGRQQQQRLAAAGQGERAQQVEADEPAVARPDQPAAPLVGVARQRDPRGQLGQHEGQDQRAEGGHRPQPDRRRAELGRGEGEVREDTGRHRDDGERDGEHREELQRALQLLLVPERGQQLLISLCLCLVVIGHWSEPFVKASLSVWRSPGRCRCSACRCGGALVRRPSPSRRFPSCG